MFDFEMFFGRFHPLIVHIPIGFLLLALLFKMLDARSQSSTYRPALKVTLALSAIVAVVTCLTGLLLSWSGTYPDDDLGQHKWAGIVLAILTIGWYFTEFRWNVRPVFNYLVLAFTGLFLLITGHRGGVLTHGDNYLWEGMPISLQLFLGHDPYEAEKLVFDISNLDSALVYEDIVRPILEARCYSCHSDRKQKAELRLDSPAMMRQGGESGDPLIMEDLARSKLYHVLNLPLDDDAHMPPKGKTQLTKLEVEVIGSWIREGGEEERMAMQYQDQKPLNEWYDDLMSDVKLFSNPLIPAQQVSPPDEVILEKLRDSGLLIQAVGANSNYLVASFINVPVLSPDLIEEVVQLQDQLIWIDLSGQKLSNEHLDGLIKLAKVTDLNLAQSTLPDNGLEKLSALQKIQILNLTGVSLSGIDINVLGQWPELRKVFTYQSGITPESVVAFRRDHPHIVVDTGGYFLPVVARDTIVFKYTK